MPRALALVLVGLLTACSSSTTTSAPSPTQSPAATGAFASGPPSTVVRKVTTGGQPCGVVAAEGAVWVTDAQQGVLRRVDRTTGAVRLVTRLSATPCELVYGFGSLWVATQSGVLDRVDPGSGRVVARIEVGQTSYEPVVAFGHVWVSNRNSGTVSEVDPATDRVVATVQVPGQSPGGLVEAADRLWVGNDAGGAKVLAVIDPRTRAVTEVAGPSRPSFVAVAAGRVWVASEDEGTVTPYDPATRAPAGDPVPAGQRPVNLTGLLDREVWVPDDVGSLLTRIDAATGRAVERLAVCTGPAVAVPAAGDVWVSCFEDGQVWQVRPGALT